MRSLPDLHLKLHHRQRSEDMDPRMGEGTLPTEEVVEWWGGEKLALGPLPSHLCGSLAISANLGGGGAACGWKGAVVAERPEDWCR